MSDSIVNRLREKRKLYEAACGISFGISLEDEAADRIESLEAQLQECKKDAERYRFIRSNANFTKATMQGGRAALMIGNWREDLDAAIDAALSQEKS